MRFSKPKEIRERDMSVAVNDLFDKLIDRDTIRQGIKNAAKDKCDNDAVLKVIRNLEYYVEDLRKILIDGRYIPAPYIEEDIISEDKVRHIAKHPFYPDRCIEHCIAIILLPKWDKFIKDCTFASWKGRGINAKNKRYNINHRIKHIISSHKLSVDLYCFKFDISKCYQNVNHKTLKFVVRKTCKDKRVLKIIFVIIDAYNPGLPIGSYLSQLLINIYLTLLDIFITEQCKIKEYVRYMDDGAIFDECKERLHETEHRIMNFLWYGLGGMELNNKRQIFPIGRNRRGRAVDICGYCFYRNFTLIRKRIKKNIKLKVDKPTSMASYKGLLMHCESNNLVKSLGYEHIQRVGR